MVALGGSYEGAASSGCDVCEWSELAGAAGRVSSECLSSYGAGNSAGDGEAERSVSSDDMGESSACGSG